MKINQNISAVIVNDQLLRNENSLSESVRRLSSGFKFNSAKDNPSGVAISYKMQAQINALTRAASNAIDGTSMVETIDGSMGEMTEVLQRMRELSVQAANDTNMLEDREAIQQEIEALKKEVDRISKDTEYNGEKLLDGGLDRRSYVTDAQGTSLFDQVTNVITSDEVQAEKYNVMIGSVATHTVTVTGNSTLGTGPVTAAQAGKVYINGAEAVITEGMTIDEVYEEIQKAASVGNANAFASNGTSDPLNKDNLDRQGYQTIPYTGTERLYFVSERYGSEWGIQVSSDNPDLAAALGIDHIIIDEDFNDVLITKRVNETRGADAEISIQGLTENENYTKQATVKTVEDKVIITDKSGFEISFDVRGDMADDTEITIEVTDIGTLQLQIGANEDQELAVRVPVLNTQSLYIDDVDVTKVGGADRAIAQVDTAISIVTTARSKMGAYENSLDFAKSSLDATIEDMTTAISRLADVDMAEEMTTYTNANVLTQAATSVLAQANDLPQQVLSLLQ